MTKLYSPFLSREGQLLNKIGIRLKDETLNPIDSIAYCIKWYEEWLTQIRKEYEKFRTKETHEKALAGLYQTDANAKPRDDSAT